MKTTTKRNEKILRLVAQDVEYEKIAKMFDLDKKSVTNMVYMAGGMNKVKELYSKEPEPKMIAVAEEDLLRNGLKQATDKLSRVFIKLALEMNEEIVVNSKLSEQFKYLQILAPIIKNQVREMKPTNINFFVGEGNAEDLERRMLEYATGQAKKQEDEH